MHVSVELQQKVLDKANATIKQIETLYQTKFHKQVQILFTIDSSRLAGDANYGTFVVRINPHFLAKYPEETIETTVPHEIAHLGVHQVYHLDQQRSRSNYVGAHGPEWKSMMRRIGADPSRCHNMEADEGVGRQKTKYGYKCSKCGDAVPVGPKIHANLKAGKVYHPRCCGRSARLVYVGMVGQVSHEEAARRVEAQQVITPPTSVEHKTPDPNSKIGKCYIDYKSKYKTVKWTRQQWIQRFVLVSGATPAGASTYYNTINKMFNQ